MIGIYKITNLINNKIYIGQSVHIERRWSEHKSSVKTNKRIYYLHKAMCKYGINNFKFEVLVECPKEDLDMLEIKYIK